VQSDFGAGAPPDHFTDFDPGDDALSDIVAQYATSKDAPILELGCNCGKTVARLVDKRFTNLHGVDLAKRALDMMEEWFPQTSGKVTLHHDFFQRYLPKMPDRFFDIVYTNAVSIEESHPSFNMVKEIARVTQKHAILALQENSG